MRSFLDYLVEKKATKEQTEAITQTEGNIRVASVPGSGKNICTYIYNSVSYNRTVR